MKSKTTAYLLWFFLGFWGVHKFYLNKTAIGILYMFTAGLFGIGWLIDAFTIGKQVETYNLTYFSDENKEKNVNFSKSVNKKPELIRDITSLKELPEDYSEAIENFKIENSVFHIEYVDYEGKKSSRDIEIKRFEESDDRLYLFAYCYLANDNRQFLVDRIVSISFDNFTIQNPRDFLWSVYKNSSIYKTQEALNEHIDEILILVFLGRADGKLLKNEREIIGRYIDIIVPGIDAEAVEKMLKKTNCELADFNKIIKRAKLWETEIKELVLSSAAQIVALKKKLDPMEKATFEKLKAAIG